MGMSASQARLLSITSRLTNNEFRSQTITNSKLRLATESEEASRKYMDALEQKQLMFMCYDDNGDATKIPLTAAVLYDYGDIKNQYSLINPAGKILVSSQDAKNYEETDNLYQFLSRYGLIEETEDKRQYDIEMEEYQRELEVYNEKMGEYKKDYAKYIDSLNQKDLSEVFSNLVGTSENPTAYCYEKALSGDAECYLHLLNHLLDFDGRWPRKWSGVVYKTSTGDEFTPNNASYGGMGEVNELVEISNALNEKYSDGSYKRLCDGDDDLNTEGNQNILTPNSSKLDKLMSDYYTDGTIKSLKQKTIDMYYIIQNQSALGVDAELMNKMLINFTEGDMKKLTLDKPEKPQKPIKPTLPSHSIKITDKNKAQWYTNLWNRMNGSETSEKIEQFEDNNSGSLGYTIENIAEYIKNPNKSNYEIFEDNLYTSSEWLLFALEHGIISIEKASFTDPTDVEDKTAGLTSSGYSWISMPYTSAADIVTVDNEKAIAIAEVRYKREITEIENKDKKYDQDLKKLDTEHNALQTEYEAIREAINKNVERSFKAFS